MSSNQDSWKLKEQSEEARYAKAKEQEQLAALKKEMDRTGGGQGTTRRDEIEGGLAPGMEDLEDRYATTSGEH
ncbi:hypothetical protein M408DRAFT_326827 [Serendipita vermifera MAFF 305830]|uniref:Uncharacterized protein n=1 Tax=Serendipita vermifera MAFF 305830 TaxID=933852 RepID=A0A0C2XTG5_SERVB|nr:hypothetical protein M408DRAFT_326827 [Serendipita vermifera MAFF 305830]